MPPKAAQFDYVQRLIQAEEERGKVIAAARQKKAAKVRQAKTDAERAVAEFRKDKDAELARYEDSLTAAGNAEKAKVHADTERQIDAMRKIANVRVDRVADVLTSMICTVDLTGAK
jgi:V-type H+-transporting ATPase subunit G